MNSIELQDRLGKLVRLIEKLGSDGTVIWQAMERLGVLEQENERLKLELETAKNLVGRPKACLDKSVRKRVEWCEGTALDASLLNKAKEPKEGREPPL